MTAQRVVLDCNVWLDWLHFADPHCAAFDGLLAAGRWQLVSRADCRAEWQRVLGYPQLALDPARRAVLLARHDRHALLVDHATVASEATRALPRCRDRDDQKWLELARDAGATLLLSRDAELLRLDRRMQRDFAVRICTPQALALR